jgi:hypothetical protein
VDSRQLLSESRYSQIYEGAHLCRGEPRFRVDYINRPGRRLEVLENHLEAAPISVHAQLGTKGRE